MRAASEVASPSRDGEQIRQYVHVSILRLRASLRLLATAEGGRKRGIASGYRCQWRSDRKPDWNGAAVDLEHEAVP